MDQLEELIRNNKDHFNRRKMLQGHIDRFEAKLGKQKTPVYKLWYSWGIAAAAVLALVLFLPLSNPTVEEPQGMLSQINPEYGEVEFYFTSSIQTSVSQFNDFVDSGIATAEDQEMVNDELKELEERQQQLMKDLELAPDDDIIINAMIEVYQKKLKLMNSILEQLYEVKQRKDSVQNETSQGSTKAI